ncbi:hypothetical protein T439DRAFT_312308 [Meredithblackwellia eburnea MCA 4105]
MSTLPTCNWKRRRRTHFASFLLLLPSLAQLVSCSTFNCVGGSVYVLAHPDDDLLFQSPDLYSDVAAHNCITTVYLTSGDSGLGSSYAQSRESGNEAAFAYMSGVGDSWTEFSSILGGQPVLVRTLTAIPSMQKVWFRLPDGDVDGSGYASTNYQTLRELYFGSITSISSTDGTSSFTLATLQTAISEILTARQPSRVRTLDYLSDFDGGDHSDHLTAGKLTKSLVANYAPLASVSGYMGYPISNYAPTMTTSSTAFKNKSAAFFTYTPYDPNECTSYSNCLNAGRSEASWLTRQYIVTSALATTNSDGVAQTPVVIPTNVPNVASLAVPTVSSLESGSSAFAMIDGNIQGYPGNSTAEWSSNHGLVGTWAKLTWSRAYSISFVVLYDRINTNDWITGGTLTFSDGTSTTFGALYNDGSATLIQLATPKTTTSILMTVTSVDSGTQNVGLAEFRAYGTAVGGTSTSSSTSSTRTSTSSSPSASATSSQSYSSINLVYSASSVTASTVDSADGSLAVRAFDGQIGGYTADGTGDQTVEWSSDHQGVGATLTFTWSSAVSIAKVVLYDRPNLDDQVTGGTLTFSDGSTVTVPSLPNAGSALTLTFAAKSTTSLKFTVTSVSATTQNIGLSELQAYGLASSSTANGVGPINLARYATATASSSAYQQYAYKAIDGTRGGYTTSGGDPYSEWATSGQGVGATLQLTWPSSVTISSISLYDRPNLNDWAQGGTITFSDGGVVTVPSLNNDGTALVLNLKTSVTVTSLIFKVTAVSSTTSNVGLSEIEAYTSASTASGAQTVSVVYGGSTATPSSSSSTRTSSSSTRASSTTSTSSAPSSTSTIQYSTYNLAYSASITASSQDSNDGSLAVRAIDGQIGGYTADGTGDQTLEWSSDHQGAGATLTLTWTSTVKISKVTLYDRPNLDDQVTGGTLTFSDGTSVTVPSLPNDGSALSVTFSSKSTTSLKFTVTSVSSTTQNIGLSEIQAFDLASSSTATGVGPVNWARYGSASASSVSIQQGASKSIDGTTSGYLSTGGDPWSEWATSGGGVGSTLTLSWSSAVSIASIILFDRPNLDDWVQGATITFGDGTSATVPSLNNNGTATPFNLAKTVSTSSLVFKVTAIGPTTGNVGLSEIQVFSSKSTSTSAVTLSVN